MNQSFGTHQQYVGIAQYDVVHRRAPITTFHQITAVGVYVLFQGDVIAVQTAATAPCIVFLHHVFGVEFVRKLRHTYREEQTRVGVVLGLVVVLGVEAVE